MTVFNEYAKELDKSVKAYFEKYRAAEKKLKDIDAEIEEVTADIREFQRTGNRAAEMKARARLASLQVYREAAAESFRKVQKENGDVLSKIRGIRERLENAANKRYTFDPDEIDQNFFTVINSATIKPADYKALYDKYLEAENMTMVRLVGEAAGTASESAFDRGDRVGSAELSQIGNMTRRYTPESVCSRFDELFGAARYALGDPNASSYNRSIPNPIFMDRWDELCGETIEEF